MPQTIFNENYFFFVCFILVVFFLFTFSSETQRVSIFLEFFFSFSLSFSLVCVCVCFFWIPFQICSTDDWSVAHLNLKQFAILFPSFHFLISTNMRCVFFFFFFWSVNDFLIWMNWYKSSNLSGQNTYSDATNSIFRFGSERWLFGIISYFINWTKSCVGMTYTLGKDIKITITKTPTSIKH